MSVTPTGPKPAAATPEPEVNKCSVCNTVTTLKCSQCKEVMFCGQECQKNAWPNHKVTCKPPAKPCVLKNATEMTFEIDGQKYACFKCIKVVDGIRIKFFAHQFTSIYDIMKKAVKKFQDNPETKPATTKSFLPTDEIIQWVFEMFKENFNDPEFTNVLIEKTGLSRAELEKEIQTSLAWLKEYHNDPKKHAMYTFTGKDDPKTIHGKFDKIYRSAFNFIYNKCQFKNCGNAEYPKDFCPINDLPFGAVPKPIDMSCVQYILAIKDKDIHLEEFNKAYKLFGKFAWWKERGYKIVATPQEGDVAVFFFEKDKEIHHVGIYLANGMIKSKPGVNHDFVYEHPWYAFIGEHGNRVAFLRRDK